jgi:hypothetical protein
MNKRTLSKRLLVGAQMRRCCWPAAIHLPSPSFMRILPRTELIA